MKLSILFSTVAIAFSISAVAQAEVTSATIIFNKDLQTFDSMRESRLYAFTVNNLLNPADTGVVADDAAECKLYVYSDKSGTLIPKGSQLTYAGGVLDSHDRTFIPSYGGFFAGGWYESTVGFGGPMTVKTSEVNGVEEVQDIRVMAYCHLTTPSIPYLSVYTALPSRATLIEKLKPYLTYQER